MILPDDISRRDRGHQERIFHKKKITTVAGTGTAGFSWDGAAATQAALNNAGRVLADRPAICTLRIKAITAFAGLTPAEK